MPPLKVAFLWSKFMSYNDVVQAIADATQDAQTLEDVINDAPDTQVTARLGRKIWTLATINHRVDVATTQANQKLTELQDTINTAAAAGAGANGWTATLVKDASGKTQQQVNDVSIKNGTYDPVLGSPVKFKLNPVKASLLYGISDPTHLDDSRNNFRGLNSQNAWDDSNIPIGGVAFGRNNVPFAYLSTAFGHDCVAYGVASLTGGAGSATGNPDVPSDGANFGYCSFSWGKDTAAEGRISTSFGQNNVAGTVHSFASGFESKTGKGSSAHPVLSGTAIDDNGDSALVHGYRAFAYGNYSLALGNYVRTYHGSKVIGSGLNPGSLLEGLVPKSIVLGSGVDIPTIILTEGDVVANGAFGKVGFNTKYKPRERVEVVIKDGDKIAIRSSNNTAQGGGTLDLQGTLGDGKSASIFRIEYNSPNSGQAFGVTNFYQNDRKAFSLNEYGEVTFEKRIIMKNRLELSSYLMIDNTKVLGGRQAAIANTDGSTADNARAINAILAAMRGHGLIAS